MPDLTLEPGSPSDRIVQHLHTTKAEKMARSEVAKLLGITPALVDQAVQPAIGLALVTAFNDMDEGRCYRPGPRMALYKPAGKAGPAPAAARAAVQTPPAAASGAPAAPAVPKPERRGGKRNMLPPLQLALLEVKADVPLPRVVGPAAKGCTKYDAIFDSLAEDNKTVTGIPRVYKSAIKKALTVYMRSRPALAHKSVLLVRDIDSEHCGVWRLPKGAAGTEKLNGRPPREGKALKAA